MSSTINCLIKEAKGLKKPEFFKNPNPFVEIHYENKVVGTTKSVHQTIDPSWYEEINIPYNSNSDKLDIVVKDRKFFYLFKKESFIKQTLGKATINLNSLNNEKRFNN